MSSQPTSQDTAQVTFVRKSDSGFTKSSLATSRNTLEVRDRHKAALGVSHLLHLGIHHSQWLLFAITALVLAPRHGYY